MYSAACDFLQCENRKYSPDEIKKIYRKGIITYHPDKRQGIAKEIIDSEYYKFLDAIKVLKQGGNDTIDEDYNIFDGTSGDPVGGYTNETTIIIINEMYDLSEMLYDVLKNHSQHKKIKSPTQIVNYNVSTFDLFAGTAFTITVPIAYECQSKGVTIAFSFSVDHREEVFASIGHKNYDQLQGDIVVKCIHYNDNDENFFYDEKNNELIVYKELANRHKNKHLQIILPCKTIVETFLPIENLDDNYFCGYHPKYQFIKVFCKSART